MRNALDTNQKKKIQRLFEIEVKELDIDYNNWEQSALYRSEWRKAVREGCNLLHTKRRTSKVQA